MVEGIASQEEEFDEVASDVTTGHVHSTSEVGQGETLIHWADVSHSIPTVYYNASQQPWCVCVCVCEREREKERERGGRGKGGEGERGRERLRVTVEKEGGRGGGGKRVGGWANS